MQIEKILGQKMRFEEFCEYLSSQYPLFRSFFHRGQEDARRSVVASIRHIYDNLQNEGSDIGPTLIRSIGASWISGYRDGYADGVVSEKVKGVVSIKNDRRK